MMYFLFGDLRVDIDFKVPPYALLGSVVESETPLCSRIEFLPSHKFRKSGRKLASILTSAAYAVAGTDMQLVNALLSTAIARCNSYLEVALNGEYVVDELIQFINNNMVFLNRGQSTLTFFCETVSTASETGMKSEIRQIISKHYPLDSQTLDAVTRGVVVFITLLMRRMHTEEA